MNQRTASILVILSLVATCALASRYWDAQPRNGVHANPVFRMQPQIRWSKYERYNRYFTTVPLDNEKRHVYLAKGDLYPTPSIYKFSFDGDLLFTWNSTDRNDGFSILTDRKGIIYAYSDLRNRMYAIDGNSGEQIWRYDYYSGFGPGSAFIWSDDESMFYTASSLGFCGISAKDGSIVFNNPAPNCNTAGAPQLIRSKVDSSFVVQWCSNIISKYDISSSEEIWTQTIPVTQKDVILPSVAINEQGDIFGVDGNAGHAFRLTKDGDLTWVANLNASFQAQSPVLANSKYFFVGSDGIYTVSTDDGKIVQSYHGNDSFLVLNQMLWNNDVLYALSDTAIYAFDTRNPLNLKLLWRADIGMNAPSGGMSIGSDGSIFLATDFQAFGTKNKPFLVSLGCPIAKHINSDGTKCV